MRFGIFSVVDHHPRELARTVGEFYDQLLEHVQLADELGFESFWVSEHHFHEYGAIPSPPVWMGAAAVCTRRIRLGSAVSVLPFHNPLVVAEQYAMVDVLSGGRLEFGVGSGYLKHEFSSFGVDFAEKYERFDEALEIIRMAWGGERFSYHGKFTTVKDVALQVVPVQRPLPPILIAILRSEAARRVGERGYPVMTIPYAVSGGLRELAHMASEYKAAYRQAGHGDPSRPVILCAVHTHVAGDSAGVDRFAKPAIDRYVRTRLYAISRPFEVLDEKKLIACGEADKVISVIRSYEQAGFNVFLAIFDYGGMERGEVMRSTERFAREVLPAFR